MLESVSPAVDGASTITCWTFHLSPFAIAEEASEPVDWSSFSLLRDTDVLLEVGHPNLRVAVRLAYGSSIHSVRPRLQPFGCCTSRSLR